MAVPLQSAADVADDYLALQFVIQQLLSRTATVALVKVVKCTNTGGVSPYGFVDVIPLVNQVAGSGQAVPHGTLYKLPYFRLQGGTNAVILDPQPDDIGLAAFCARDISAVKSDPAAAIANANAGKGGAPPGSARQFDMADGLYIGGLLNGTPVQFVQFAAGGVTVKSPTKITLQAPEIDIKGTVVQTDGDVSMSANLTVGGNETVNGSTGVTVPNGDVLAGTIGLKTHKHPTAPTGPVSPPIP